MEPDAEVDDEELEESEDEEEEESEDDSGDERFESAVDPYEEALEERRRRADPAAFMDADQRRVFAQTEREREAHEWRQHEQDELMARQLELNDVDRARAELDERAAKLFARRWKCCLFLFDVRKLQQFCIHWQGYAASELAAPQVLAERARQFHATRKHACDGTSADYGTVRLNGDQATRLGYQTLINVYRKRTGVPWKLDLPMPSIEASQLLLAHIKLAHAKTRNSSGVLPILKYVHGRSVTLVGQTLAHEHRHYLWVLKELCHKIASTATGTTFYDATYGVAPTMLLEQLLYIPMPLASEKVERLRSALPGTDIPHACMDFPRAIDYTPKATKQTKLTSQTALNGFGQPQRVVANAPLAKVPNTTQATLRFR